MSQPASPQGVSVEKRENQVQGTTNTADDSTTVDNGKPPLPQTATAANQESRPLYSVFSTRTKMFLVLMTVFATLFSPLSAFIYLPAITPIAEAYNRSVADINLTVTLYQIMQAIAPVIFGDLSDQVGRRPVYMLTFAIYIGANIGLALQHNYAALMVLRALQATGCTATVAIASAVMADFSTPAERGGYITAAQASVMFIPAFAPVLGGVLTQFLGWRSTFWALVIAAGLFLAIYLPFAPESARNIVGNGSIRPRGLNASITAIWLERKKLRDSESQPQSQSQSAVQAASNQEKRTQKRRRIPIPNIWAAVLIIFEKDVGLLMLFMSLLVMANYAMLVPLQDVIRRRYDFNDLQVGLCYIPFAFGSIFGSVIVGRLLNWNYARVARSIGVEPDRKRGDDLRRFPIERARLGLMWPWILLAAAMTMAWGWVVDSGASLAAPLVVLFFAGFGLAGPVSILTTLLVDLYPMNPGRVSSSFNLTRSSMSSVGSAVVQYIINAWGYGYTYLFFGLLVLVTSSSVPIVMKWGPKWREERYQRFERQRQRREAT